MTSSPGQHLASFPDTPDGILALAARLLGAHGEQVTDEDPEDYDDLSAAHAAAHQGKAPPSSSAAVTEDETSGQVLVTVTTLAGEAACAIGAGTASHIRVTPVDAFTYQGRRHEGDVMLRRPAFHPDGTCCRRLTRADNLSTAGGAAFNAISAAVSRAVGAHVPARPEVVAEGNRAAARFRARQLDRKIAEAEKNLELLRAERARLLEATGQEDGQ
jgi:hypothetical protein